MWQQKCEYYEVISYKQFVQFNGVIGERHMSGYMNWNEWDEINDNDNTINIDIDIDIDL